MCVVLGSTGSEFHSVGAETVNSVYPSELFVFEEQQDFHAQPIIDAGSHYRLVRSYQQQGMKEQHHVGTKNTKFVLDSLMD